MKYGFGEHIEWARPLTVIAVQATVNDQMFMCLGVLRNPDYEIVLSFVVSVHPRPDHGVETLVMFCGHCEESSASTIKPAS